MSQFSTFATCRASLTMSVDRARPEVAGHGQNDAIDLNRTSDGVIASHLSIAALSQIAMLFSLQCIVPLVGGLMKRREFITLVSGAAASPLVARAQQPAKMKRIAMVHPSEPAASMIASYHRTYRAFFDELSRLGFVEGKNLIVERYSAEGQFDRFAQLARAVADTRPDAIFALDGSLGIEFKAATTTIPIVTTSNDPVALGLVSNIARPGGNVTGTAIDAGLEIWGKRIGLLKEALPKMSNVRIILTRPAV